MTIQAGRWGPRGSSSEEGVWMTVPWAVGAWVAIFWTMSGGLVALRPHSQGKAVAYPQDGLKGPGASLRRGRACWGWETVSGAASACLPSGPAPARREAGAHLGMQAVRNGPSVFCRGQAGPGG